MLSIAKAIIANQPAAVHQMINYGVSLNEIDEYGFTPLIETAIMNNAELAHYLLDHGADVNLQDVTGGTAIQWAVENNNKSLCELLIHYKANVNSYNFAGQPVLVMPLLRKQPELRKVLTDHGADLVFAQDYINTKLLGHVFELVGTASIVSPSHEFVEVDFEGFYLEVTLGIIAESLSQFQNHFAARKLRRYSTISKFISEKLLFASDLIKYHQHVLNDDLMMSKAKTVFNQDAVIIPVAYEGHAITFIKFGHVWVKCDRREDARVYDKVIFYKMTKPENLTVLLLKDLIFIKQDDDFINRALNEVLGLQVMTELSVEAQISGNCSWANVEATIPALFFLLLMQVNMESQAEAYYKTLALNYFHRWREWSKERSLQFCIQRFKESDSIRKGCHAEILAAILFQRCASGDPSDQARADLILSLFLNSPYDYILRNYLRIYYFESYTEEGKRFAQLLEDHGFQIKK